MRMIQKAYLQAKNLYESTKSEKHREALCFAEDRLLNWSWVLISRVYRDYNIPVEKRKFGQSHFHRNSWYFQENKADVIEVCMLADAIDWD